MIVNLRMVEPITSAPCDVQRAERVSGSEIVEVAGGNKKLVVVKILSIW